MNGSIAVIADDLSGASSTGAEFARCGLSTVLVQDSDAVRAQGNAAQVLIFDTESRYDTPPRAREKVSDAARALQRLGPAFIVKKFDSLLRGPFGHEIDAIMSACAQERCVVLCASPKMGRITVGGYQLVDGLPLAERMRMVDPGAPVASSYVPDRLREQTARPVHCLDARVIAGGAAALAAFFDAVGHGIVVADSATQADLNAVVAAAHGAGVRFFAGTYGLGEALRPYAGGARSASAVLVVAGSTSDMTRKQVARLEAAIDARSVVLELGPAFFEQSCEAFGAPYIERLRGGGDLLLHTSGSHEASDRVRQLAAKAGWDEPMLAARIEALLQFLVTPFLPRCNAFVFSGGATAQSIFRLLGADGLTIYGHEVLPGTPVATVRGGAYDRRPFLTKPGSFGTSDDLVTMVNFARFALT
ncbi:YgbK domain-containing protein [Caballeronia sordidicola]|uniref:YgbK domain-containing protein n=1 Tax=Caballeronia sordidicola TaxID=196367 RepID=A0A158IA76_CABSO|nr:four-carbon acid sugar kinase family protein [Caballeronia sordidicola]SAL53502.1 YgbK domain-containing protein [Caballeronia sordidicola]